MPDDQNADVRAREQRVNASLSVVSESIVNVALLNSKLIPLRMTVFPLSRTMTVSTGR